MAAGDQSRTQSEAETQLARQWDAVRASAEATPESASDLAPPDETNPTAAAPAHAPRRLRLVLAALGVALALLLTATLLFAELGKEDSLSPRRAPALAPGTRHERGRSGALRWTDLPGAGKGTVASEEKVARSKGGAARRSPGPRESASPVSAPPDGRSEQSPGDPAAGNLAPTPPPAPVEPAPAPNTPKEGGLSDGSKSSAEFGL